MSEISEFLCFDSLPEAIVVAEVSGGVLYFNRRARGLFGLDSAALPRIVPVLRAPALTDFIRGFPAVGRRRAEAAPSDPLSAPLEVDCRRLDGSTFPAVARAAVEDGRIFVSIREPVAATSREAAAEAALQQQRAFFALFNHDARQSLQAIQFLIETLAPAAPETVSIIAEILASVRRLLDTVLRLNDTGAAAPVIERCALADVLQRLRRELEPVAHRKGLTLHVAETAEYLDTDPVLLGELLQNLVANAIRYTRKGHVRIDSRPSPLGVRVEIADTGVGMSETQLGGVFSAEGRGSSTPRAGGGSGLGLVIVKRLADVLGYRVEVTSKLGEGSSFTVTMPRKPSRLEALRAPDGLERDAMGPRSLGAG